MIMTMKNKKNKLIIGLVFLGICFTIFIVRISRIESKFDDIHSRFTPVLKVDSLDNYVVKKHTFKGFKYTPTMVFITLDNDKNYKIYSRLNPNYSNKGINDILEEGDKLIKDIGNDTIYIVKKGSAEKKFYHFLLKPSV